METRKVQLSGGTTYTVSLPKTWAQEHGISAGSVLSLHPNGDGSLLVTRHFRQSLTDLHEVEKLDHGRAELFEYYYASRQFERIADHAVKIAEFVRDPEATLPDELGERLSALADDSRQVVDTAADVILTDVGIEAAHLAFEQRSSLADDIADLNRELYTHDDPGEAYVLGLILDSIRRTAEYGRNSGTDAIVC